MDRPTIQRADIKTNTETGETMLHFRCTMKSLDRSL